MSKSELVNLGKRFVEVQMQNVDLEQDLAILRKKFRELLTQKVDEKVIKQAHEAMPSGQENAAANQY